MVLEFDSEDANHLYNLSEKKARKFSANLGKLIYNRFIKK